MGYRVIITGTTGMVGEGVLLECLADPQISEVLSVSRRTTGMAHPKLKEYLMPDFLGLQESDENLSPYDACFFCAGVSSIGMNEAEYSRITYDTTLHFANVLAHQNPGMVFIYVSGTGTDSSEQGRMMWARVKGRTENALLQLPFRSVYNFRPGIMKPVPSQKRTLKLYKYLGWLFPFLKRVYPNGTSTLQQVAHAMIKTLTVGSDKQVLEVRDINALSNR
jgi:hypothetical protein